MSDDAEVVTVGSLAIANRRLAVCAAAAFPTALPSRAVARAAVLAGAIALNGVETRDDTRVLADGDALTLARPEAAAAARAARAHKKAVGIGARVLAAAWIPPCAIPAAPPRSTGSAAADGQREREREPDGGLAAVLKPPGVGWFDVMAALPPLFRASSSSSASPSALPAPPAEAASAAAAAAAAVERGAVVPLFPLEVRTCS